MHRSTDTEVRKFERESFMNENEGQQKARTDNEQKVEDEKGPTEKLQDQAKSQSDHLVPGTEVPGAQNPDSEEIKDETNPNTE
jgi:hypothetical protein